MGLREELKAIIGNRRRFILLRIADVDTDTARKLCNIKKGTYTSWVQDPKFQVIYRRRDELSVEYKQEAIQLLRRNNQLQAVLLEEKILNRMKEEIESGEYILIRTMLARDVYSKLIADLDYQPQAVALSWEQRIQNLLTLGGTDGTIIEGKGSFIEQPKKSLPAQEGEQEPPQDEEAVKT